MLEGFPDLVDLGDVIFVAPGADRLWFWDHSAQATTLLTAGSGLSISSTTITVAGLTTSNFTSAAVSQWTNDAGYITSVSGGDHGTLTGLGDDDHTQYVLRSILTTNGDLYTRTAGVIDRLAVGGANTLLGVSGGLPAWVAQSTIDHGSIGGLGDDDHTQYVLRSILTTNGDLFTRAAGVIDRLAVGGANTFLGVSGGLPAWVAQSAIDHGSLGGLSDDDHTQYLLVAGTRALSANWDAGSFQIRAETFQSDIATGTAPFTVASTTVVTNLNADLLDGQSGAYYLDSGNFTGAAWTDLTDGGDSTAHQHSAVTIANEASDTSCFVAFFTAATGNLQPKTNANLVFNSSTGTVSSPGAGATSEHFGASSASGGSNASAFGNSASAAGSGAVAVGKSASAAEANGIAIGNAASAPGTDCVVVGASAAADDFFGLGSVAVGKSANAGTGGWALAFGVSASASVINATAIGTSSNASGTNTLCIGSGASASAADTTCIGAASATNGAEYATVLGAEASTTSAGDFSVVIGALAGAVSGNNGVCIGYNAAQTHNQCLIFGAEAASTGAGQAIFGSDSCSITQFAVGKGPTSSSPATSVLINATDSNSVANLAASALIIRPGSNRGNSTTSYLEIQTGDANASGTTAQTQYSRLKFSTATNGGAGEMTFNEDGRNYDARFEGDTDTALMFLDASADCIGVSTTAPLVKMDVNGGVAWRSSGSATSLTADNQAVTVGNRSYISLSSNDATATNRTFTLSNGLTDGQNLILAWNGTNAGEIVAATNLKVSATWTPTQFDTLRLIWSTLESAWLEISRSANA